MFTETFLLVAREGFAFRHNFATPHFLSLLFSLSISSCLAKTLEAHHCETVAKMLLLLLSVSDYIYRHGRQQLRTSRHACDFLLFFSFFCVHVYVYVQENCFGSLLVIRLASTGPTTQPR